MSLLDLHSVDLTRDHYLADWIYEKLVKEIQLFESELDDQTEVALKLSNFGNAITLYVTSIG